MKQLIAVFALLASAPAFAAVGDPCPISRGSMNTSFVGTINDGSNDLLVSDRVFSLRVPFDLSVKFSGGIKTLTPQQVIKFTSNVQDANGYCIASSVTAQPLVVRAAAIVRSRLRGSDGRP